MVQKSVASQSTVAGATGYSVKRSLVSGGPYTTIATDLTSANYLDTGLTAGTGYYYIVTSQKLVAESAKSIQVRAVPLTQQQAWRQTFFGTTADSGIAADNADPDGDGWTNANEFTAGTDPTDHGSLLVITSMAANGSDFVVTFPSVTGRLYSVECSTTLAEGSWQPVLTNGTPATGIAGTGTQIQIMDTGGALHPRRFYRIIVTLSNAT